METNGKDGNLEENGGYLVGGKWRLLRKDCFNQAPAKLTACDYHAGLDMVVVGFSNVVFGLYRTLPDFVYCRFQERRLLRLHLMRPGIG